MSTKKETVGAILGEVCKAESPDHKGIQLVLMMRGNITIEEGDVAVITVINADASKDDDGALAMAGITVWKGDGYGSGETLPITPIDFVNAMVASWN